MLTAADIDLESLILARNDPHDDGDWWFDPRDGQTLYYGVDDADDLPALVDGVHLLVPRAPQPRSDVEDFLVEAGDLGVDDETVAELYQAFRGKGGLRRFRERVLRSDAAEAWTQFAVERESARALAWLQSRGVVA